MRGRRRPASSREDHEALQMKLGLAGDARSHVASRHGRKTRPPRNEIVGPTGHLSKRLTVAADFDHQRQRAVAAAVFSIQDTYGGNALLGSEVDAHPGLFLVLGVKEEFG